VPHHIVKQGDTIVSIAEQYSLSTWLRIYDHPENAGFRQKRPNPNLLYPGDEIFVPERVLPDFTRPTDHCHKFVLVRPKQWLQIVVQDHDAQPLANAAYELRIGAKRYRGKTGADGLLAEEIDPCASSGRLKVGDHIFILSIGHLNPLDATSDRGISGIQGRLRNLGYPVGPIDGQMGPKTRDAIRYFQADESLPLTGEPDGATRARLLKVHGV
jgi:N-acetylmuramoyl-L-alanine amidase